MERPHFIFPFFSRWTCRLFLFATMNSDLSTLMYKHWPECLLSCQEGLHHNHAGTLISDCQPPEWPLFINPTVYGVLLRSFSRLRHVCLTACLHGLLLFSVTFHSRQYTFAEAPVFSRSVVSVSTFYFTPSHSSASR